MIVRETTRESDILSILLNPDIYNRMASDNKFGVLPVITLDGKRYIGCYLDGEIIGVCIYVKKPDGNIIHFYVLPEFRFKYAKSFAVKALKLKYDGDVFAITPECYMPVVNFALKVGFKMHGTHEDLFFKNGIGYRQIITRFTQ